MAISLASVGGDKPKLSAAAGPPEDYELLIEATVDYAIFRLNVDGTVATWNPGAARIKGYTRDEIIGHHFRRFYTPAEREAGGPELALKTAREVGRYAVEGWRLRKDGTQFRAYAVIDAIRDQTGAVIGFVKITQDVTERWKVQSALEESERRFRLLVDGVTDYAIYMLDASGLISNWNAGAERIKGYRADEVIGRHFSMFFTPEDLEQELPQRAMATAATVGRYDSEGWRRRKDGTRFWAGVVLDAIRGEGGKLLGFAKVTRDLTEKREAAARLTEMNEQLTQAQKLEALGQLTGGMAHDFNNLLTAILGATRMAQRHGSDPERLATYLEQIRAAAQRGAGVISQLMAFARREPAQLGPMDVGRQIEEVAPLIRQSLKSDISLLVDLQPGLRPVTGDATGFGLALLNLALNARDAMPQGGRIQIKAEAVSQQRDDMGIHRDVIAITVTDSGAGIPAELLDKVMAPFFTTKPAGKGTGLGLNQVRNFVEAVGGAISISSTEGEGTSVRMDLPVTMSLGARLTAGSRVAGRKLRVLIVEDEPAIAQLGAEFFAEMDHEPHIVHSAEAALEALEKGAEFDLMFSDVVMPNGISGLVLARKVRGMRPYLPILLTTGFSHLVESGLAEFPVIRKPYEFEALAASVSEILARQTG